MEGSSVENIEEVQRNFGKRAANYRQSSVHGNSSDLERMVNLINPSQDDIALDVATGGGHTAIQLAAYTKRVVAIDITNEMLEEAHEASKEKGITNIQFKKEDVHNLSFEDGSFDIVTSRFAVHHFAVVNKALSEMCRVLKPGGKLYIFDCSVVNGEEVEEIINRIELLRDSSHFFSYSERLWNEMLRKFPLEIEQINVYKNKYEIPSWFERMETTQSNREEIYRTLYQLPEFIKEQYPFSEEYITTYRIEVMAKRL